MWDVGDRATHYKLLSHSLTLTSILSATYLLGLKQVAALQILPVYISKFRVT